LGGFNLSSIVQRLPHASIFAATDTTATQRDR
jgi:hypothetical protein